MHGLGKRQRHRVPFVRRAKAAFANVFFAFENDVAQAVVLVARSACIDLRTVSVWDAGAAGFFQPFL